jgi:hypothetical protein
MPVTQAEQRKQLSALASFHDDLPAPESLLSLVSAEDAPTLPEFLDIFDAPVNLDLDSERVWPMPPALKY